MRRIVGVTLTALGAFLVVGAIMCRFYVPGQVIKFPLNEYSVSRLAGTNVSYFSQQTGSLVTGATVHAISTTQGDVRSGNSSMAVWNNVTGVFDVTHSPQVPISYSTLRFAFNRRTGALINCCGAEIGTARPKFSGQSFVWPIGTQQQSYQVFNTSTMKPETTNFTGTDSVDGLSVYVFVQPISHEQIGTITVPGSLVNITDQATVTLPEYLTATNTYYVDPGTGSPVKVIEAQNETLGSPGGGTALTLFSGTLTTTPASAAAAVNIAQSSDDEIRWVQDIGPLIGVLVGLLLLVAGILLLLDIGVREYEYEEYDDDEAVGAEA